MAAQLEHANVTVSNASATAAWMCDLFDWHIRWQGASKDGGTSLHVGTDQQYLALYEPPRAEASQELREATLGGLNHIAMVVDDIDATEKAVKAAGFTPKSHANYEPGRRFYFFDHDQIEYEIVAYP